MKNKDLAIIGGGASGMVFVIYFAKIAKETGADLQNTTLHLIDPSGFGYGGIAYGQCAPKHILNTRRNEMSPWDVNKFRDFLIKKGRVDDEFNFDFRLDYYEFLQSELEEAFEKINELGGTLVKHQDTAFIKKDEQGLFSVINEKSHLVHDSLKKLSASQIILTVGYGPNENFFEMKKYIGKGFLHSLYPYKNIENEPAFYKSNPKIAVAGSAAAIYDFILACPCKPQETTLYIFSAAGEEAQEVREVEKEETFLKINVDSLINISSEASSEDLTNAIKNIYRAARESEAGPDTWIAFNIMMVIAQVLQKVSVETAVNFRQSMYFKKIRRQGGPTTRFAAKALETYKTIFIPNDLSSENIERLDDGTFLIKTKNNEYNIDCLVNATGHGRHNSPILEKMKIDGLAEIDIKTDVLSTDETGCRLTKSNIACIGPSVHFGTDGIQTFAKPAEKVAFQLLRN